MRALDFNEVDVLKQKWIVSLRFVSFDVSLA